MMSSDEYKLAAGGDLKPKSGGGAIEKIGRLKKKRIEAPKRAEAVEDMKISPPVLAMWRGER